MAGPAKRRTPKQSKALAKSLGIRSDMARALGLHQKPGRKIGSKLVPARIKHNGKVYAGKVKRVNGRVKIFVTPEVARKINPEAVKSLPSLPSWNTYAGGTSAAAGKSSYDIRQDGKQYSISPYTTKYGRHAGYLLNVFPGTNHAHQGISPGGEPAMVNSQTYRSPQAAAGAAKKYHQRYA